MEQGHVCVRAQVKRHEWAGVYNMMSYCGPGSLEDWLQMVAMGSFPDRDALELKDWGFQSLEIHHKKLIDGKGK